MYLECVSCPKLGNTCDGPNFMGRSAAGVLEWCKARKKHLGWSNAKLAEESNMPKGTIDRLLSGEHLDFKYETIRPMVKALVGGSFDGNPCPAPPIIEKEKEDEAPKVLQKMEEMLSVQKKVIKALCFALAGTLLCSICTLLLLLL